MTQSLSPQLQRKVRQLFTDEQSVLAIQALETGCGDALPLIASQGDVGLERVRAAALKLSQGSLDKLDEAIKLAQTDWRDVLLAAGFGHSVTAHQSWLNEAPQG
ncbi:hypothetical protein GCM10025771_30060 [Niveibacterium umoris]|uniref:Uncharacterized protein n=1 Tax=Niveibacterium umoris TaxID=1193620 RepID=A0A840BE34_9RHOO|nr:hypothetical protein [Niveibacterium umoris]MBB4011801.1 hypothetical protein [Niveibacterium umoris]